MPLPAPTAAPPNFYESLPSGGPAAASQSGANKEESETDDEILKGLSGVIRVLTKVGKMKKEFKAQVAPIKEAVKSLIVNGLKKSPSDIDTGEDDTAAAAPPAPAAASPKTTDETHAA